MHECILYKMILHCTRTVLQQSRHSTAENAAMIRHDMPNMPKRTPTQAKLHYTGRPTCQQQRQTAINLWITRKRYYQGRAENSE